MNITSILIALLVAWHHSSIAEASKSGTRNMIEEWEKVTTKPKKCKIAEMYISDGSRLGDIIASLVEEQDFSSYCNKEDFDAAKDWFFNADNHPTVVSQNDDEYMKVRFLWVIINLFVTRITLLKSFLFILNNIRNVSFSL